MCLYINISSQATWSRRIFKALASSFLTDLPAPKNAISLFQNPAKLMLPSGWETTTSHVHICGPAMITSIFAAVQRGLCRSLGVKAVIVSQSFILNLSSNQKRRLKATSTSSRSSMLSSFCQILSILDLKSWNGSQCKSHSTQTSCSRISSDHLTWQRQGCAEDLSENDWPPICAITFPQASNTSAQGG